MKLLTINIPEYNIEQSPDHDSIGRVIDNEIKHHFLGKSVLVRGFASTEHPDISIDELVRIIEVSGTDRYDPGRVGDRYENIESKQIDLFAFPAMVSQSAKICSAMIYGFYHSALGIHGRPMRIDVVLIYDATMMKPVPHQYEGRSDIKEDGFVFRDPTHKSSALLGVIKVG